MVICCAKYSVSAEQLAPGTFFADVTNQALFVWDAGSRELNKTHVEGKR